MFPSISLQAPSCVSHIGRINMPMPLKMLPDGLANLRFKEIRNVFPNRGVREPVVQVEFSCTLNQICRLHAIGNADVCRFPDGRPRWCG
jgi:hypothetical protein